MGISYRNSLRSLSLRMVFLGLLIPAVLLSIVPVLHVDAAYGKVLEPKCRIEYETETSYEKRCSTTDEKKCDTIDLQECSNTYERECSTHEERQCTTRTE